WKRHLHRFRDRPASHITAFAILHEITAIVPMFGVYYALDFYQPKTVFPEQVLQEGNRVVNKLRSYAGMDALDTKSPVLAHLALSYAVVKAAAPLRIAASIALTPWTAKHLIVPFVKQFSKLKR
ncbi:hypothetical protein BX667DRAFT_461188, partial [Coemansia mojavensis]